MNNVKAKTNMKIKIQDDTIVYIKEDRYSYQEQYRPQRMRSDCPWKSGWLSHNNSIIMNNNG